MGGKMLYTEKDMMLFSLIYSDLDGNQRFHSPKFPHDILYRIFFHSISKNKNIFKVDDLILKNLILEGAHILKQENPRINIEKRIEKATKYLLSEGGKINLNQLKIKIEREFLICDKEKIKYIEYFSPNYPKNLKKLKDPPFMIFYIGNFPEDMELERSLAVIGSRNPDKVYGVEVAKRMGKLLAKNNWWNISGLALGCDQFGHIGSLEGGGKTGAILGQGLAQEIYPSKNRRLAEEIIQNNGFLMSELPPTTPNLSLYFILRNRLQSGLTCGIFVVQTGKRGGSLHTIKYSLEQERKTLIWDSSNIKELKNKDKILGNTILIEGRNDKLGVNISKKLREKIVGVKHSREIFELL
jgi:DNA processing protein